MSLVKSFTANGVLEGNQNVVFGIQCSTFTPPPPSGTPASGWLLVTVRDDAAVSGSGTVIARFAISPEGGMQSVIFPAGVRCNNGVAITITNSSPDPHDDVVVVIDYS
jgi:hypothetical protein